MVLKSCELLWRDTPSVKGIQSWIRSPRKPSMYAIFNLSSETTLLICRIPKPILTRSWTSISDTQSLSAMLSKWTAVSLKHSIRSEWISDRPRQNLSQFDSAQYLLWFLGGIKFAIDRLRSYACIFKETITCVVPPLRILPYIFFSLTESLPRPD